MKKEELLTKYGEEFQILIHDLKKKGAAKDEMLKKHKTLKMSQLDDLLRALGLRGKKIPKKKKVKAEPKKTTKSKK